MRIYIGAIHELPLQDFSFLVEKSGFNPSHHRSQPQLTIFLVIVSSLN